MNPTTTPTTPAPEPTAPTTPQPQMPADQPKPPVKLQRWLLPVAIILIVIAAAIGAWMYFANKNDVAQAETPTAAVTVTDNGFTPATIKIKKGQDVTWTNQSHSPLQVVGDQKSTGLQPTEAVAPGETYSFTFDDSGTYNYHEAGNLNHKGIVVVE